ncbi:MAG TPA: AmmeMemoRadiSam system protein B [Deltaproteobacteria bacterium]|nr:AmmeMemoRadiSam system protein B [Deltaproteobacteria bacterium]
MQRHPAVAGQFYPGNPAQLKDALEQMIGVPTGRLKAKGVIAPHAGYIYSGGVAGRLYAELCVPQNVLVIGPNHHGAGAPAALYPEGEWITPLGSVAIDNRLNSLISRHTPFVQYDDLAHRFEHSLEVQIPFLQYLRPDVRLSAICLGRGDYEALAAIGEGLAQAISEFGQDVLIVASSDMTHYESADSALTKDNLAIERVLALDPQGLLQVCHASHISMCGVGPAAVMLVAARRLGAARAELVCYGTSGDVSGDMEQVVGYASLAVT